MKTCNKLYSIILVLFVCLTLAVSVSASSNSDLVFTMEPSSSIVEHDGTFTVRVNITENPGFKFAGALVTYDTTVLEYIDKNYSGSFAEDSVAVNKNQKGVFVNIGNAITLDKEFTGTGLVATLTFKVIKDADLSTAITLSFPPQNVVDLNGTYNSITPVGSVINITTVASDHQHTPGEEATCTTNQICTACGMELKPALGHNMVVDAKKNPTCTETGLTEGSHCTRCDGATVAQQVVPALGHNIVKDAKKDPTCTATGLTQGSHCTRCNGATVAQQKVPALGHNIVTDAKKDPTCTETGLTEGSHCSVCNTVIVAQTTVEALGHTYGEWTVTTEPTETEVGVESRTCSVCNDTETREIPATGVTTTPPTNTTDDPVVSTGDGEGDGESKGFPWVIVVVVVVVLLILLLLLLLLKKKKKKA